MENNKERIHLTFRKENGQIGYMSKGIPIPEFYELIQPKQQNIQVQVLIDFYPVIDTLCSLQKQKQNDEIYVKFNSMYSYWNDARTHKKESIVLVKSETLAKSSDELLNILKIKLKEHPFTYKDKSYQKWEKIQNFIEYSDMYIETILCFIHSKASLEIESFKPDKVLTDYIECLNKIISNLYLNAINLRNDTPYHSSFLQYLALKKSNELENFLKLHGEKYSVSNFKIFIFNELELYKDIDYYSNNHSEEVDRARLDYTPYDENEIKIAILLRNTLFKIKSISKLLEKLKEGNVEWSSDNNDIKELESFLQKEIVQ